MSTKDTHSKPNEQHFHKQVVIQLPYLKQQQHLFSLLSFLNYKSEKKNRKHNGKLYSADPIAEEYIHTDIARNPDEPQQTYRFGTVCNGLLRGFYMFYWIQTSPSASAIVQPNQTITTNSTDQNKTFNIYFFTYFLFLLHKT